MYNLKEEFRKELSEALNGVSLYSHSYGEIRKRAIYEVEETLKKRHGYKMACIANPANGDYFFDLLFSLDWDSDHNVTVDKLKVLTSTKLSPDRLTSI